MPRIRTIKPEFPQSESMGRVSRDARLLFVLLWTLADDAGRLRGNSRMLASLLFPYDDDAPGQIGDWLKQLASQGCVIRYVADDGATYVQICNWLDHQKIDKASDSKLPAPTDEGIQEASRILSNPREPSRPSRARADRDQGSRTKDQEGTGTKEDCNEAASQPSLPPSEMTYPDFPCVKGKASDKQVWSLSPSVQARFAETFPEVNIDRECRKAYAWVMAKPSRKKTYSGMEDFLRRWLAKEQDRPMPIRSTQRTFAQMQIENTISEAEAFANG